MKEETQSMTLASLAGGAALESFDAELKNVLNNIADPNTVANAVRKVTLEVKLKPNKDRNMMDITFGCKSALAPAEALETHALITKDKAGRPQAHELKPVEELNQGVLPITQMSGGSNA